MKLDNWEPLTTKVTSVLPSGKSKTKSVTIPGGKSLKRMEDATNAYFSREANSELKEYASPKVQLQQMAEKLVRHRRARERTALEDPLRWESYMGLRLRRQTGSTEEEEPTMGADIGEETDSAGKNTVSTDEQVR